VQVDGTGAVNIKIVGIVDLNLSVVTEIIDVGYNLHLSKSIGRKKTTNS
jgi:hypothetical protein